MPRLARRWLGHDVTSRPNSSTCPDVAGKIPLIRLNSVVLPAPFGPMIALRSPGMILSDTPFTARRPPKTLHRSLSSRTGVWPLVRDFSLTHPLVSKMPSRGPLEGCGPGDFAYSQFGQAGKSRL